MDIVKVSIQRPALEKLQSAEREFVVSLSYATNQISLLHKLLLIANRPFRGNEVEESGRVMTIGFLLRMLAGHVNEGWEILGSMYFRSKLSVEYDGKLPDEGRVALKKLKDYFGRKNLIRTIRSGFAFHVPKKQLKSALKKDTEPLEFYFAAATGNCLYMGAEALAMWELIADIGSGDHEAGMDRLFEEVLGVSRWFIDFANNCLLVFFKPFEEDAAAASREIIRVDEVARLQDLRLPFLFSVE